MLNSRIASRLTRFGTAKCFSTAVDSSKKYVRIDDESNFRRITMCNDRERNALGLDMIRSLQRAVDSTDLKKCRAIVISSAQLNVFSAGYSVFF